MPYGLFSANVALFNGVEGMMGRLLFAILLSLVLANPALADAAQQARRLSDTAQVGAGSLTSLLEPLPAPVSAVAPDASVVCGQVTADQYWLCRGLTDNNCGVVAADRYWLCQAVNTNTCGLTQAGDFWFCQGITTANCSVVQADRYWLCEGVVRGDCSVVEAANYRICPAFQAAIRRLSS